MHAYYLGRGYHCSYTSEIPRKLCQGEPDQCPKCWRTWRGFKNAEPGTPVPVGARRIPAAVVNACERRSHRGMSEVEKGWRQARNRGGRNVHLVEPDNAAKQWVENLQREPAVNAPSGKDILDRATGVTPAEKPWLKSPASKPSDSTPGPHRRYFSGGRSGEGED